jgi:hypothetical protein
MSLVGTASREYMFGLGGVSAASRFEESLHHHQRQQQREADADALSSSSSSSLFGVTDAEDSDLLTSYQEREQILRELQRIKAPNQALVRGGGGTNGSLYAAPATQQQNGAYGNSGLPGFKQTMQQSTPDYHAMLNQSPHPLQQYQPQQQASPPSSNASPIPSPQMGARHLAGNTGGHQPFGSQNSKLYGNGTQQMGPPGGYPQSSPPHQPYGANTTLAPPYSGGNSHSNSPLMASHSIAGSGSQQQQGMQTGNPSAMADVAALQLLPPLPTSLEEKTFRAEKLKHLKYIFHFRVHPCLHFLTKGTCPLDNKSECFDYHSLKTRRRIPRIYQFSNGIFWNYNACRCQAIEKEMKCEKGEACRYAHCKGRKQQNREEHRIRLYFPTAHLGCLCSVCLRGDCVPSFSFQECSLFLPFAQRW